MSNGLVTTVGFVTVGEMEGIGLAVDTSGGGSEIGGKRVLAFADEAGFCFDGTLLGFCLFCGGGCITFVGSGLFFTFTELDLTCQGKDGPISLYAALNHRHKKLRAASH